jgi:hypothetical protein
MEAEPTDQIIGIERVLVLCDDLTKARNSEYEALTALTKLLDGLEGMSEKNLTSLTQRMQRLGVANILGIEDYSAAATRYFSARALHGAQDDFQATMLALDRARQEREVLTADLGNVLLNKGSQFVDTHSGSLEAVDPPPKGKLPKRYRRAVGAELFLRELPDHASLRPGLVSADIRNNAFSVLTDFKFDYLGRLDPAAFRLTRLLE